MSSRFVAVLAVAGLGQLPVLAGAGERKAAEVECTPVEQQALVYDCMITLKGRKSGTPVADAEFTVGADMPSMPGATTSIRCPPSRTVRPGCTGPASSSK